MEMRHGMPVWAPNDHEMNEIRRRVSRERAKVARELMQAVRRWFRSGVGAPVAAATSKTKVPFYY
jgi:hypothetical protein